MSEWQEVSLDSVAQINPTESLSKGTLAKKIAMDALQPFTKRPVNFELEPYNGGMKFKNGDTIVARITPCLENGKTAYIDLLDENEVAFGSTEYIVLREKLGVTDKQFLYYFSISPIFRDVAIASMTGSSGRQRVQTDVVKQHVFEMPPIEEQKAIASVLSSLDDKIDLLHRQNTTLESMAETLFRQWFVEEAEEDWDVYKVSDFAEHLKQSVNPAQNPFEEYHHYSLPAFDESQRPVVELGSEILSNKYRVLDNTILVSKLNPRFPRIWAIQNIASTNSVCSTEFQVFKPKQDTLYAYLYFLIGSSQTRDALEMAASGTSGSHQRVRPEDILNITTQLPSIGKAVEFSEITQLCIDKVAANRKQIQTLERLRDNLLPKLMSGEVRIKNG